ncbi:MAG: hypothetical protein EXR99_08640 [Gemmataceae bacterium]|nr:hypothetical protein [Gemmataceae bacterium]
MNPPRIRIKEHRRVRACELEPHPQNPRIHPELQSRALADLLAEVGFARSLLAYETTQGKLRLIDGHLRRGLLADAEVVVEVLDVNEEEARALLLSIDPLSALAVNDEPALEALRQQAVTASALVREMWNSIGKEGEKTKEALADCEKRPALTANYLVLVDCASEQEQGRLLEELQERGMSCKALIS